MNEPASFGTNEERPFNWPEDDKPYWSLNCTLEGNTLEHPPYRTSKWGYCFVSFFNWPEEDKPYWSLNCSLKGNTLEHPPYRTSKWGYCFVSLIGQKMINHTGVSIVHWKATP